MNTLDRTMAQALEGETVETQFHQLRAEFEPSLGASHERVKAELEHFERLHQEMPSIDTQPYGSSITSDDLLLSAKIEFQSLKAKLQKAKQISKAFALRHGLSRSPVTPQPFESLIVLGLYIVLEALLNAGFLNNAYMVAGAIQALVAAILISLTNVTVSCAGGYFIGRCLSYGLHTADSSDPGFKKKRDAAWIGLLVFISVMGHFHLTVGLIRAQESLHIIEHSISRYAEILTTPEALFLLMVGIVMSCVSWKKGLTAFDDPYPGFGEKQRKIQQIQDEMAATYEDIRDQMMVRHDELRETLDRKEKAVLKIGNGYNQKVSDCYKSIRILNRNIEEAEIQLRVRIANVIQHHRAALRMQSNTIPMNSLEQFIQFDQYRIAEKPAYQSMPDFSSLKIKLDAAQVQALERLTSLYEQFSNTDTGERT
jgi:hypothetical protein